MSEYIEINILSHKECFICFEEINEDETLSIDSDITDISNTSDKLYTNYVKLNCCNSSNIHKLCLFKIFLTFYKHQNSDIMCPLCRTTLDIKDYFNLEEILLLFSKFDENTRSKYIRNINIILLTNYFNDESQLETLNLPKPENSKKAKIIRYILISLFALIVVGVFATHFIK